MITLAFIIGGVLGGLASGLASVVAYAAVVCGSREDAYRAGLLAERRRHAPD